MTRAVLALLVLFSLSPAAAQQAGSAARNGALVGLARVFGELHHIRRLCEPARESDVWRDRMKRLIDLEQPTFDQREAMVAAFNDGYLGAQTRHPYCDAQAEDYAAARAAAGEALVSNLTAALYAEQNRDDAEGVVIVRGVEPQ